MAYLKRNEKLPIGSYFYIQVGHLFYAGEETPTVTEKRQVNHYAVKPFAKGENTKKRWQPSFYRYGYKNKRYDRDYNKGSLANYLQPNQRERSTTVELLGQHRPKLTDDVSSAKRYREKKTVERACKRLRDMYRDINATVSVHFYGETK